MSIYRPRAAAVLYVPNVGTASERVQQENETNADLRDLTDPTHQVASRNPQDTTNDVTRLQVKIHHVRLVSNSHNEADECEFTGSYDDMGTDPRFLNSVECYVYLGDGDAKGFFTPSSDNLRFVGIGTVVTRTLNDSVGKQIHIRALDYTTLFLNAKQYPPSGIPKLSMTLGDAWNLVCDSTGYYDLDREQVVSTVQRLKTNGKNDATDRLQFIGDAANLRDQTLGSAVSSRIAKLGNLQVIPPNADAWAVWQTAVGSLGLISFIRGDRCIVTTATDYYTADDPPRFIWGKNIRTLEETRDVQAMSKKNIHIQSLNPLTMKTIEAFWPPLSLVKQSKKVGASSNGSPISVKAQDYETFDCPMPITDQAALTAFAERVWLERGRQELAGQLETGEMFTDTLNEKSFDLLKLQSGDRIRVEIDRDALTIIQRLSDIGQRIAALKLRGYSDDMAAFLAKNLDSITKVTPEFQVHSVETTLETASPPGSYTVVVHYLNRIDVSGSAQPGTGIGTPPITNQSKTVANPSGQRRRNNTNAKGGP